MSSSGFSRTRKRWTYWKENSAWPLRERRSGHFSYDRRLKELWLTVGDEKVQEDLINGYKYLQGGRTEPGSSFQWFLDKTRVMGTDWNMSSSLWTSRNIFSLWEWPGTVWGCSGRQWSLQPWWYSDAVVIQTCAKCSRMTLFEQAGLTSWPPEIPSNLNHAMIHHRSNLSTELSISLFYSYRCLEPRTWHKHKNMQQVIVSFSISSNNTQLVWLYQSLECSSFKISSYSLKTTLSWHQSPIQLLLLLPLPAANSCSAAQGGQSEN